MMRTSRTSRNTSDPSVTTADAPSRLSFLLLVFFLCGGFAASATRAQDIRPEHVSAGILVGPVSGIGIKATFVEPSVDTIGKSTDLSLAFNLRGYVYLSSHVLQERLLPASPLRIVIGPGMVAELDDETIRWGLSGTLGAYFLRGPYEILLQVAPRFMIAPERLGSFGAAVGIRYRF